MKYKERSDQSHTFQEIKKWLQKGAVSKMGLKRWLGLIKEGRVWERHSRQREKCGLKIETKKEWACAENRLAN